MLSDPGLFPLAAIVFALAFGGVLKGATGAGVPVVAVPVIAAVYSVPLAVVLLAAPNFITNLWQLWQYRAHHLPGRFTVHFAVAGALGALLGTVMLANLPASALSLMVALSVTVYIGLRVLKPGVRLEVARALRLAWPMGALAGILQGAAGISAPISVSFLNAMRLERPIFIATISTFFAAMSLTQLPALFAFGLMTPRLLAISLLALLVILAGMPLGAWLAKRLSAKAFDRVILCFLSVLALRLYWTALT